MHVRRILKVQMPRTKGTPDVFTPALQEAFLEALKNCGVYTAAAAAVGLTYRLVYQFRQRNPDFQERCDKALGRNYGELMDVARKLAIEGLVTETYDKAGNVISSKRVYSERILLKMLARLDPAGWSDKVQVDQKVSAEIRTERIKVEDMTPAQRRAARDFLATIPDSPDRN